MYLRNGKHCCFMVSDLLNFEISSKVVILQTDKKKQSNLNRIRMVPACVKITMKFFWSFGDFEDLY